MRFHEWVCSDLNILFGKNLGWEYSEEDMFGELPDGTPLGVRQQCRQYADLSDQENFLVAAFQNPDTISSEKAIACRKIREMLGIKLPFSLRDWADENELTAYAIGRRVKDATGANPATVTQRWQRWLGVDGSKTLEALDSDLRAMGYKLAIEKIEG